MKEIIIEVPDGFGKKLNPEKVNSEIKGEVVRCKDCKYWYFADNRIPCEQENVCGRNGIVVTPDWYCADGERKGGEAITNA